MIHDEYISVMQRALLFILLSIFFRFLFSPVTEAVDIYSVWTTNSETARFCDHVHFRHSVLFQQWFNDLCDIAAQQALSLENLRLTNVFILHLPIIHCMPSSVDIFIETQYDTPEVRATIQSYALRIKDMSQENIILHLIVHPAGIPFEQRDSNFGRYIIRHQLLIRDNLEDISAFPHTYQESLHQLALETNVPLKNMWYLDGRIQITLLPPDNDTHHNLRLFLERAQHTLGMPVEIVQGGFPFR